METKFEKIMSVMLTVLMAIIILLLIYLVKACSNFNIDYFCNSINPEEAKLVEECKPYLKGVK